MIYDDSDAPADPVVDYRSGDDLRHWRSMAAANVSLRDLKGLRAIAEEAKLRRHLCVRLAPRRRRAGSVEAPPYAEFLGALWSGEYS